MRTVRVTGRGRLKIRPDTTRLTLTLSQCLPEYGEALRISSQNTEGLKKLLSGLGFERGELKTLSFSIDTEYEDYREGGEYRRRFVGYRFTHVLKLDFASDSALLGRLLYALSNGDVKPEVRISYTVRDQEAAKNALLAGAVADAKAKAKVLSDAAGVKLLDIQSIDYSWGEITLETRPMNRMLMAKASVSADSLDMDIEPDDIDVTDTVTVIWEIA